MGDYEEMEATYKDYRKKLWFNGAPSYINPQLLKRLAVAYCTKVSVTDTECRQPPSETGHMVRNPDAFGSGRLVEVAVNAHKILHQALWFYI